MFENITDSYPTLVNDGLSTFSSSFSTSIPLTRHVSKTLKIDSKPDHPFTTTTLVHLLPVLVFAIQ